MNTNIPKNIFFTAIIFFSLSISVYTCCAADGFVPGAVFREYRWHGPWANASNWQRVTDPDATHSGAQEFLPNPVNKVIFDDLDGAVRIEVCIEVLQCHAGTHNKRIRLNGNEWLRIPEANAIPGGNPECYQTLTYPVVEIPLSHVLEGLNTFELTAGNQICYSFGWGQFIIYGVTFRVFYDDSKPHTSGEITEPVPGATIGENPVIAVSSPHSEDIVSVDFIGYYEDFNFKGDNIWCQWQYSLKNGILNHHLGTARSAPFGITWDTAWIPDQDQPMKIMARIIDKNGMHAITPAVQNIRFVRNGRSVVLYKPSNVPKQWVSRAGSYKFCRVTVTEDLQKALDAKMILVNWAGTYAEKIGINNQKIVSSIGLSYDRSYDEISVPLENILQGDNTLFTYSATDGHGIEVNWPGIVLKIRYSEPVGVGENEPFFENGHAAAFRLLGNTPNPFNSTTVIWYELVSRQKVSLTVYDIQGKKVALFVDSVQPKGIHTSFIDGGNLPTGLYFYRLRADNGEKTGKMMLIK
ncbi:T9SS type A sorting domain-containing protein [bacterium]|nr:T9SS type A sorting domain-containing protein [bacterium]